MKPKQQRKVKTEKLIKSRKSEPDLFEIKNVVNPANLKNDLEEINETTVDNLNLHENKEESLVEHAGDFGLIAELSVGDNNRKIHFRFLINNDSEHYINGMDMDYGGECDIFNGYFYKLNAPQFNLDNRSQYGKGTDFKQNLVEFTGNICYIPSGGCCFLKYNKFFFGKEYKQIF